MGKDIKKLIKLIENNPEREVIAMVETEVVASDDFSRWIGSIGNSRLDSYYNSDEKVHFLSNNYELIEDYQDFICSKDEEITNEELTRLTDKYIKNLNWTKAIVVNIDTLG